MIKAVMLTLFLCLFVLVGLAAQDPGNGTPNNLSLPGNGANNTLSPEFPPPVNDIVEKRTLLDRRILAYDDIREADIMWQKRIWRVLDVREKINHPFANPERPLITILMEAAERGDIQLYGTLDDKFTTPLTEAEREGIAGGVDTVEVVDPQTYAVSYKPVRRDLNPEDIRRYRLQEIWFFDKESSTMKVRILGIAPLKDEFDESGNFLYELPMFWVYYPAARQMLANEEAFAYGNDAANRSWEDVFESRYFNSYVFKESNVLDRRIGGYLTNGRDRLMEAEHIKQEIFNYEQDLWSY